MTLRTVVQSVRYRFTDKHVDPRETTRHRAWFHVGRA